MDQNEVLFWKDLYVVLVYNFFFVINGSKDRFFQACYLLHSSELLALYMYALWTLLWAVTPWPSFRNKWCINSREKEWFLGKTNKSFIVSCFAFMNVGPKQTRIYVTILKKKCFFFYFLAKLVQGYERRKINPKAFSQNIWEFTLRLSGQISKNEIIFPHFFSTVFFLKQD